MALLGLSATAELSAQFLSADLQADDLRGNVAKVEYQIYILGFTDGTSGNTVLDIQDKCYDVALYTLAYIDNNDEFKGLVSVYDYSILTLSRFSDDSSAGVKLSLVLIIPNGVNYCEIDEHFNDEPYPEEPDHDIDIPTENIGDIDITPIKLQKNMIFYFFYDIIQIQSGGKSPLSALVRRHEECDPRESHKTY